MRVREILKLFNKLQMKIRESRDTLAFLVINGKIALWTKVPHKKGEIKGKLQYFIRQQLKLNEKEFQDLIKCVIWREEYIKILKKKGFIR